MRGVEAPLDVSSAIDHRNDHDLVRACIEAVEDKMISDNQHSPLGAVDSAK